MFLNIAFNQMSKFRTNTTNFGGVGFIYYYLSFKVPELMLHPYAKKFNLETFNIGGWSCNFKVF